MVSARKAQGQYHLPRTQQREAIAELIFTQEVEELTSIITLLRSRKKGGAEMENERIERIEMCAFGY